MASGYSGWNWFSQAPEPVNAEVVALLDVAAEQFNRIQGILESPHGSLVKLAPQAFAAADEAMAEILHHGAVFDKYPESVNATRKTVEARIASLRELADRLEELATGDQTLTDKVAYTSSIDSVLEDLRLEQLARSELRVPPEDEQVRENS
jgi:hypothetical protein